MPSTGTKRSAAGPSAVDRRYCSAISDHRGQAVCPGWSMAPVHGCHGRWSAAAAPPGCGSAGRIPAPSPTADPARPLPSSPVGPRHRRDRARHPHATASVWPAGSAGHSESMFLRRRSRPSRAGFRAWSRADGRRCWARWVCSWPVTVSRYSSTCREPASQTPPAADGAVASTDGLVSDCGSPPWEATTAKCPNAAAGATGRLRALQTTARPPDPRRPQSSSAGPGRAPTGCRPARC